MGIPALYSGAILAPLGATIVAAIVATGCGDPPICQSDVFVAIQTSEIVTDVDAAAPGVQGDVEVRTSLEAGETVTLEIINGDRVLETHEATVEAGGYARFGAVAVTSPSTTLRASIDAQCGAAEDERTIEVIAGTGCELSMDPLPEIIPMFAPAGVLSTRTDPEPDKPGHQLAPTVHTRPGWTVELVRTSDDGAELATVMAGVDGLAVFADTVFDGAYTFRATCHGPGFSVASAELPVVVDITPPTCRLTSPVPGTTITPAFDANDDLADGIQLEVVAQIDGDDVEGEPVDLSITPVGGSPTVVAGTPVDATGRTTFATTLAPAMTPAVFQLALAAQDHAHNACAPVSDFAVLHEGCDIAFVAPSAIVTTDANGLPGDGSQIDVTLQVTGGCVGRQVTTTCGSNSPSGSVPANGRLTLRVDACATSPCETELACVAQVANGEPLPPTAVATTLVFDNQGPITTVQLVGPEVPCGATITSGADRDASMAGVQVVARVTSTGAVTQHLDVMSSTGTVRYPAPDDVTITLALGTSRLVGSGLDEIGNRGSSAQCSITVAP